MAIRIGFVGGGMMAEAMLGGLLKSGATTADVVTICEPFAERRSYMEKTFKVKAVDTNGEVFTTSDVVVIAVKPQVLDTVLAELQHVARVKNCLVISIIAGKTLASFAQFLPEQRVARVMPNTPALIGCGAAAYVLGAHCTSEDGSRVETIMGSCGLVERVANEGLLDAVTGLSGSGPAYVFNFIEALSDGGVRQGLPRATATRLAAQTVLGAARMVAESGKHPGELKDQVTSPGGTTIAGVHALETGAFRGTVMNAVEAATKRSEELGKPSVEAAAKRPRL